MICPICQQEPRFVKTITRDGIVVRQVYYHDTSACSSVDVPTEPEPRIEL